jgi:group II intron reverse transcriptase/maturase
LSIPSNDRLNTRETKIERLGARAKRNSDTIFNNLGHILDADLLREIYQKQNGNKAIGIDKVTKETYGIKLEENIENLIAKIRKGIYRPKPSRITNIPKDDGSMRPLAVACFEDKLVQAAVSEILTAIYEPIFLPCFYGFRPNKNCHDALKALCKHVYPCWDGAIVEVDIQKYFNSIPHKELRKMLEKKITDTRFLRLIDKLATAPILDKEGIAIPNEQGCPQGSILSPILANIYLHEVIDTWFYKIKQTHFAGKTEVIRYADDMIFVFENSTEAKCFYEVLPKRLARYGLTIQENKSRLIKSGQNAAAWAHKHGQRLPTYNFLGFTVYWGKARNGKWWRIKFKSRRDRITSKLQGLKRFLRESITVKGTNKVLRVVSWVVQGWVNYYSISDNQGCVWGFINAARRLVWQWLNRRGRRDPLAWERFNQLMITAKFPNKVERTISIFS